MPARFAKAGYRTGYIGKAHFKTANTFEPTGTPECRQSPQPQDWYGPYMGFQHVELMVEGHNTSPPLQAAARPALRALVLRRRPRRGEEPAADDAAAAGRPTRRRPIIRRLPVAWHNSTWIGDRTIEFLRANRDQPFCAWASFPDPHHPFDCPEPWSRLHHPDEVDLPEHRTMDLERRPWWHRESLDGTPQDGRTRSCAISARSTRARRCSPTAQLRDLIANYYGMISLIDHNVGRILAGARRLGLADNTLVVYSTDHGDWLGDHGLILKGPMAYEGLLRVGLLVRGPGVPEGQGRGASRSRPSTCRRPSPTMPACRSPTRATAAA